MGGRSVKEEEFNQVKLLQAAGLKQKQICTILKRSPSPIAYMLRADTWDEFIELNKQRYQKSKTPAEQGASSLLKFAPGNPKPPELELELELERARHYELMTVLESIDESLKFLVDHLPVPEKRKLFR